MRRLMAQKLTDAELQKLRLDTIYGGRMQAHNVSSWRNAADNIALLDLKLAARCRDVADALSAYAQLCQDIIRSEGL